MSEKHQLIDFFLREYLENWQLSHPQLKGFKEAVGYSLLQEGSKRFRPILALLTAEMCGLSADSILPFAAAVEMVHTYSLVHDDLPCMDNDDIRRGQPTNHRVFGEATALLVGDALLTEAFSVLAKSYQGSLAGVLVKALAEASGYSGMIGGQVLDLAVQSSNDLLSVEVLDLVHRMKTGRLIALSVQGVALLAELNPSHHIALETFGNHLGLAFQVADDLLDFDENKPEKQGFPFLIGYEKTRSLLQEVSQAGRQQLDVFGEKAWPLRQLIDYNQSRIF